VGLIQREIEKQGIPTISVTFSLEIAKKVKPPRAVHFGFPLGHPFGFPNQKFLRKRLLHVLLEKVKTMDTPGTVDTIPVYGGEAGECAVCEGG
jgi:hypothetical protein